MTVFLATNNRGINETITLFGRDKEETNLTHPTMVKIKESIVPFENLQLRSVTNATGDSLPYALYEELKTNTYHGYPWRLFDSDGNKLCEKFPELDIKYFTAFNNDNQWAQLAINKLLEYSIPDAGEG